MVIHAYSLFLTVYPSLMTIVQAITLQHLHVSKTLYITVIYVLFIVQRLSMYTQEYICPGGGGHVALKIGLVISGPGGVQLQISFCITGPAGAAEQANVRKQRRKKVSILSFLSFFTLFCILTVTMLVLVSLSAFQFNPNRTTQYEDTESNTQTTLAIVNPFFTHKVTVTDNEENLPQYQQHMVSLSMLQRDCRELVYESNPPLTTSNIISQSDSNNVNPTPPFSVKYNSFLKRSRPESDSTMSFLGKVDDCTLPDPCEISINSSLISKRRCIQLSALIQPNPNNTFGYVNITLTFVPTLSAAIGFSVVGVLFILTCPWFVLACYCFFAY